MVSLGYERQLDTDNEHGRDECGQGYRGAVGDTLLLLNSEERLEWSEIRPTSDPSSEKVLKKTCVEFGGDK